jgi:hypothetical protein
MTLQDAKDEAARSKGHVHFMEILDDHDYMHALSVSDEAAELYVMRETASLRSEIEALRKEREWISVKDRLPDTDCMCLVWNGEHKYPTVSIERYSIDYGFYAASSKMTHWKLLITP